MNAMLVTVDVNRLHISPVLAENVSAEIVSYEYRSIDAIDVIHIVYFDSIKINMGQMPVSIFNITKTIANVLDRRGYHSLATALAYNPVNNTNTDKQTASMDSNHARPIV